MPEEQSPKGAPLSLVAMAGLAGHIGYTIAIPAVLFGVGGAYLDRYLGTPPLFMIVGLSLAITISAMSVMRIVRKISASLENEPKAKKLPVLDEEERESFL